MNVGILINKIKEKPDTVEFDEVMDVIANYYDFTPTEFINGPLKNKAGENSGSCQLFRFAQQHRLTESQTLACFGHYYRDDVLKNPDADNHQNIRHFMETGWQGISFQGEPLRQKIT